MYRGGHNSAPPPSGSYTQGGSYGGPAGGGYGGGGASYSDNRGSGYQGGDRGGRGGGRGRDSNARDGDWRCPNPGCGNSNFARRTSCHKCGEPALAGVGAAGSDRGGNNRENSGGYGGDRGGRGRDTSYEGGRSGGNKGGSYGNKRGRDEGGYGQLPQSASSYGSGGNPTMPYGGNDSAVPPPSSYSSGGSYPQSYGGNAPEDYRSGGRGSQQGGYGGASKQSDGGRGEYGGGAPPSTDPQEKVKQCDDKCGDACDNTRIYISNLPPDVTVEELQELFGSLGTVGRIKQKRGFKDQWPWSIKLYTDENGKNKGDGVLSYEDPSAAHSAGGFFDGHDLRGCKIKVTMAEKSAPRPALPNRGGDRGGYRGGGDRGGYRGGGDRRRDGGGPDRHSHGGNRSRPY